MKIAKKKYDIVINFICIAILVGTIIYVGISWGSIPERIPRHYNSRGEIDGWGTKGGLLLFSIIPIIMYIGITILEQFPQAWNTGVSITPQNKEKVYRILKNMIVSMKLIMVIIFSFLIICSALSIPLPTYFLDVTLIAMFGSISFFIFQLIKAK